MPFTELVSLKNGAPGRALFHLQLAGLGLQGLLAAWLGDWLAGWLACSPAWLTGLGWAGLGLAGLRWVGLDWAGLAGQGWAGSG